MNIPHFNIEFDPEQLINLLRSYLIAFVNYFVEAPLFAQILMGIGLFALIAISITLIYYIAKGIYLLIKKICQGIYKLGQKIYRFIEQKIEEFEHTDYCHQWCRAKDSRDGDSSESNISQKEKKIIVKNPQRVKFCSFCGEALSSRALNILAKDGRAFCENCGRIHEIAENSSKIEI
ncbi:MAG: hypothetical protein EU547_02740 [Promethearchaeota archaeon]|nr:MAG: hypothetical protein EU547_02740 [Candidatus Lokiarchaeota archaeon]